MANLCPKLLLIIHTIILSFTCLTTGDYCKVPTRLELVFLVDNSDPYPVERIKDIVPIADDLNLRYPNSKFGLALYSDFECKAWNSKGACNTIANDQHQDPNACYTFEKGLTTEVGIIKERVSEKIEIKYSNGSDAGINGLLMTSVETQMGWTRGKDIGGLVRLIVVLTDTGTFDGGPLYGTHNGQARKPVRGDGTDKCETMKGATATEVNKVMGRDQISVYVLVQTKRQTMWNIWRDKLGGMLNVRHRLQSSDDSREEILQKISMFIDQLSGEVGKVDCNQCCTIV